MSNVYFTSDLHLGHAFAARTRAIPNIDEHDWHIVETINETVPKRGKLFIVGDMAFSRKGMQWARNIRCQNVELILGNHDMYKTQEYMDMGWKIHGFTRYKDFWMSHCPMHPNEIRKMAGNIHGHVHRFSDTPRVEDPRYFNVNCEYHSYKPVRYDRLVEQVEFQVANNRSFYSVFRELVATGVHK